MARKGRSTLGDRNPSRLYPERRVRGDQHPARLRPDDYMARGQDRAQAKLTDDAVRDIRRRGRAKEVTQQALADEYGVSNSLINGIVKGRRWKHVE